MAPRLRRPIRRSKDRIEIHLGSEERAVLHSLADQLRALLAADADDPALRRTFMEALPASRKLAELVQHGAPAGGP